MIKVAFAEVKLQHTHRWTERKTGVNLNYANYYKDYVNSLKQNDSYMRR